ncbi:hypothetical protein ACF8PL_10600 [Delftia sp. WSY_4]|uniref:hypothetical protein n=1 Tax=unclassified Delftia TaxID=2613839 RepID=UPI003709D490
MKKITQFMGPIFAATLVACSYEPTGRWEATDTVNIYSNNDHPLVIAFVVEKGEICAISEDIIIRKDLGYAQVSCEKGRGWDKSGRFKKISD